MKVMKGAPALAVAVAMALTAGAAAAHDSGAVHAPPGPEVAGVERGIDLARICDSAIHELMGEYQACMQQMAAWIGPDPAAETAFRFMGWLRGSGAARNGYPDGPAYREFARADYLAARASHPVPDEVLCAAVETHCVDLPDPLPRP